MKTGSTQAAHDSTDRNVARRTQKQNASALTHSKGEGIAPKK
jgi:hypothetical protein